jgi:hypothetical protein
VSFLGLGKDIFLGLENEMFGKVRRGNEKHLPSVLFLVVLNDFTWLT